MLSFQTKKQELALCQCAICDNLFYVPRFKRTDNKYCSEDCRKFGEQKIKKRQVTYNLSKKQRQKIFENPNYFKTKCKFCGKKFTREKGKSQKYCCKEHAKAGKKQAIRKHLKLKNKYSQSKRKRLTIPHPLEIKTEKAIKEFRKTKGL